MNLLAAYIVPHPPIILEEIGRGEEKKCQKTLDGYKKIAEEIDNLQPDTIIISTPHTVMYQDYFHVSPGESASGSFAQFGHPECSYKVNYDNKLAKSIVKEAKKKDLPLGFEGEKNPNLDHGVLVPLSFLQGTYDFVRIGLSGQDFVTHYQVGQAIQKAIDGSNKKVVYIASGDLSHVLKEDGPYGYKKEGKVFDQKVTDILSRAAFSELLSLDPSLAHRAQECGLRSFLIMAGVLDQRTIKHHLHSYEAPFGVGYAVASYMVEGENKENNYLQKFKDHNQKTTLQKKEKEDPYVKLARASLEHYVLHHTYLQPKKQQPIDLYNTKKACFVTLKKHGQLRGCIGTTSPSKRSLAEEIIHNAVAAGFHDPRFKSVQKDEIDDLQYSVDVLSLPEDIKDLHELDPKTYGVIVYTNKKSGLLLPNLEGIDDVEKQLSIAKQKANIHPNEDYLIKRFTVKRHH